MNKHRWFLLIFLLDEADLSPDASKIAFKRKVLCVYDLQLGQLTQLNAEQIFPIETVTGKWSPDGSQIGFPCSPHHNEALEICTFDLATGSMHILTDLHSFGAYTWLYLGNWGADGKTIASSLHYPEDETENPKGFILTLDVESGLVTPVLDTQQSKLIPCDAPAISPDGQAILFSGQTLADRRASAYRFSIYQINTDGSGLHRLVEATDPWIIFWTPVWSPDRRSFYTNASNMSTDKPVRYDLNGRPIVGVLLQSGRKILSWRKVK
jgi:hypothetical protein